jgi:hypothetical protein
MAKGTGGKVGRREATTPTRQRRGNIRPPTSQPKVPILSTRIKNTVMAQAEVERRFGQFSVASIVTGVDGKRYFRLSGMEADSEGYLISKEYGRGKNWDEAFSIAGKGRF